MTTIAILLFAAALAVYIVSEWRSECRWQKAERAARAALLEYRLAIEQREQEGPNHVTIRLTDQSTAGHDERWRWSIWNTDPHPDDVRGLLVPYAMGEASGRDQAVRDAQRSARERGLLVEDTIVDG